MLQPIGLQSERIITKNHLSRGRSSSPVTSITTAQYPSEMHYLEPTSTWLAGTILTDSNSPAETHGDRHRLIGIYTPRLESLLWPARTMLQPSIHFKVVSKIMLVLRSDRWVASCSRPSRRGSIQRAGSAIALLSTLLVACGQSISDYRRFAAAGSAYAEALDTLLVQSANVSIDASSENLLAAHGHQSDRNETRYAKNTLSEKRWVELLARMRQHVDLLRSYFLSLERLAYTDAPQQAQLATERIFRDVARLGVEIGASPEIRINPEAAAIPKLYLSSRIKGALRQALALRKDAIYRELWLQDKVLDILLIQMKRDLQTIHNLQEERVLLPIYVLPTPVQDPDTWIAKRRAARTATLTVQALERAHETSGDLREAFQLLLADRFTPVRASNLLEDIHGLVKVGKELQHTSSRSLPGGV